MQNHVPGINKCKKQLYTLRIISPTDIQLFNYVIICLSVTIHNSVLNSYV